MEFATEAAPIPGGRIDGYRNSSPRSIRLLGLGERGSKVAREVAIRGFPNVEIVTNARPVGWDDIATERPGVRTNMIVIVCGEGDERLFSPSQGKPNMLITFVVLKQSGKMPVPDDARLATMRGLSDLFVTTSDGDYVGDLIDNLAN
jgi:hypothetical protein